MIKDARNMRLVGHNDLGGKGDCMHVNVSGGYAYVGHQGHTDVGTSVVDVSDPEHPRLVVQLPRPPGTHTHKVQVIGDILLVNHERNEFESPRPTSWSAGLAIYDVSKPEQPRQIGFYPTPGGGVHRMTWWEGTHAYVAGTDEGYIGRFLHIVDLADPSQPTEVGRWWFPGQHAAGGEPLTWTPASQRPPKPGERQFVLHHALPRGDRLYCGWWDAGLVILDISDPERPALVSHLEFGPDSSETHTALPIPGRDFLAVTDEAVSRKVHVQKHVRVVDISDDSKPLVVAKFPVPESDLRERGIRFGPHNLHEPRPGSLVDEDIVYVTYFAGGLRAVDVSDPANPTEVAHIVPEEPAGTRHGGNPTTNGHVQFNDVHATADGLVYVTDRHGGGLYIVEHQR